MTEVYNFLGSWQLFPEKGTYESGERPRSGTYKISGTGNELSIELNWVSLENVAFSAGYRIMADGELHDFKDKALADTAKILIPDRRHIEVLFFKGDECALKVEMESMPNGNLNVVQNGCTADGRTFRNSEIYHRQLSVLPYAASVGGALIQPNELGLIKHKALSAMEEQTNMQLDQIRKQVELLAAQAQQIQARKEMSLMIYSATLSFKPITGSAYFLYEKRDDVFVLSMIGPKEWGDKSPYKKFIAHVRLLADHTWIEIK